MTIICLKGDNMRIAWLSGSRGDGTSRVMMSPPPLIFDRAARRLRRDRMARSRISPLEAGIASELLERLDLVTRTFHHALVINTGGRLLADGLRGRGLAVAETDHGRIYADNALGVCCDEDRLHVTPGTFDLIIMPSGLDTVDDVPGALIAARTALRPGGLFLACLIGSPSLPVLRSVANDVDSAKGRAVARFHPQIDVRAAGDLLARTGFALPVADNEMLSLSYPSFDRLCDDLRGSGLTSLLAERHPVTRHWLKAVSTRFAGLSDENGRIHETVTLLILTGWAPENG